MPSLDQEAWPTLGPKSRGQLFFFWLQLPGLFTQHETCCQKPAAALPRLRVNSERSNKPARARATLTLSPSTGKTTYNKKNAIVLLCVQLLLDLISNQEQSSFAVINPHCDSTEYLLRTSSVPSSEL